jgi:dynein heavy chain, axonemal
MKVKQVYDQFVASLLSYEEQCKDDFHECSLLASHALSCPVLLRNDGVISVNERPELFSIITETKHMQQLGIAIPENLLVLLNNEALLSNVSQRLAQCINTYTACLCSMKSFIGLIPPFLAFFGILDEVLFQKGLILYSWGMIQTSDYLSQIEMQLVSLSDKINNLNDLCINHIDSILQQLQLNLTSMFESTLTLDELLISVQGTCNSFQILQHSCEIQYSLIVNEILHQVESIMHEFSNSCFDDEAKHIILTFYDEKFQKCVRDAVLSTITLFYDRLCSNASFIKISLSLIDCELVIAPSKEEVVNVLIRCIELIQALSSSNSFPDVVVANNDIEQLIDSSFTSLITTQQNLSSFKWIISLPADYSISFQSLESVSSQIEILSDELERLEKYSFKVSSFCLILDCSFVISHITSLITSNRQKIGMNFQLKVKSMLFGSNEMIQSFSNKLNRFPENIDSIKYLLDVVKEIEDKNILVESEISLICDEYSWIQRFLPVEEISKEELDLIMSIRSNWTNLLDKSKLVRNAINEKQNVVLVQLQENINDLKVDVTSFRADFQSHGPMIHGISSIVAQERLEQYVEEYELLCRKREIANNGCDLFKLSRLLFPELDITHKEILLLQKFYIFYNDVTKRVNSWKLLGWNELRAVYDGINNDISSFISKMKKLPKQLREFQTYDVLKTTIDNLSLIFPVIFDLTNEYIKSRHWALVQTFFPDTRLSDLNSVTLSAFIDNTSFITHVEEIQEIIDSAEKELSIETKLKDIEEHWSNYEASFSVWKQRHSSIMANIPSILEDLEESQINLQTMLTMRHVSFFEQKAVERLNGISGVIDVLEMVFKVQQLWCSLESVFLSGDISKQMPLISKKFVKIDKDFSHLMKRAQEKAILFVICSDELMKSLLPLMLEELERCQQSLDGYLEQKRSKFPRFYFISNPVLLQLLSQGSDPLSVQPYYEKLFDSVSSVEHDENDPSIIVSIVSKEGNAEEKIKLNSPVKAVGNVEDWLGDLLVEMQSTMKSLAFEAACDIACVEEDLSLLKPFVDKSCGQYALLGIQLLWTRLVEEALESYQSGEKLAMKSANKTALKILNMLSSWCLQDLGSKLNRTKIETLVTIQVHQRDVLDELLRLSKQKLICGPDDFDWLKQARFYWDPDGKDAIRRIPGSCQMRITDISFDYQYEYLGCKERLVITPLTDRCYITLAQAIGMYYGGAPAGPAGTGKTETVKDMGRSLGLFVVVTNCTDQMRYTDCAKIFKGLCMSGLWGCFDEFNRITLPVLSVVAQQILAITNAKKANLSTFTFPGDPQVITLNPMCSSFITMNPGYAGRQELPENLKALFRSVSMMIPDREIIMRVKLCSVGYTNFTLLARKFFICYKLCEEQLSKQKHYDFGLRNILSVLRTAGATKRENIHEDEELLLYRTIRDMNLSKLIAQDVPLFLSMLADLFPAISAPSKREYPTIESAVAKVVADKGLIYHPPWVSKVIQLYETIQVRHGIMVTGPAGSGKSSIIETLQAASMLVDDVQIRLIRINPKAIQASELYGQSDPSSGEWIRGVFASIWEKYNNRDLPYKVWIIMDGPVDAIWIEDLNTVLDDNKLLTLASGDRIPMTDNVKIIFENESLANASPATVSRAGIIYVSDTDLDWYPVVQSQILLLPLEYQVVLQDLFIKYVGVNSGGNVGHLFDFIMRSTRPVISLSQLHWRATYCPSCSH